MARTTRKRESVSSRRGPPRKKKRSTVAGKENRKDIAEKKPGKVNTNAVNANTAKKTRRKKRNYADDLEVELYRELDTFEVNDRFEGRQTRVRQHYKTADSFVVLKEDFDDNNGIAPKIWRIDGRVTFMREKYIPHREARENPRRNLYMGTGKYDNWNPDMMWINYYPVSVLYITPTRGHPGPGIVQFLRVE